MSLLCDSVPAVRCPFLIQLPVKVWPGRRQARRRTRSCCRPRRGPGTSRPLTLAWSSPGLLQPLGSQLVNERLSLEEAPWVILLRMEAWTPGSEGRRATAGQMACDITASGVHVGLQSQHFRRNVLRMKHYLSPWL